MNEQLKEFDSHELIEELRHRNYAIVAWCPDDIKYKAIEIGVLLTEEECEYIIELIDNKHDATIGINWDTIDVFITDIGEREYEGGDALVDCFIQWKDTKERVQVTIAISDPEFRDTHEFNDDQIFFYVDDEEEFVLLQEENNKEDFRVTEVIYIDNL